MTISKELLLKGCNELGINISDEAVDRLDTYARLLIDYNEKVNLTAITQPDDIVNKHFVDSLCLTKYVDLADGKKLCDVGTGAGFPGAVMLIYNPKLNITLFDSINKKLDFIRFLVKELGLEAEIVTTRAEDAGKNSLYREKFDIVTARAVASLNVLSEYCVPLVKTGGVFAPLKAVLTDEEEHKGLCAAGTLGAKMRRKEIYTIPDGSMREIIVFEKTSSTLPKFPRNAAQISKKPL